MAGPVSGTKSVAFLAKVKQMTVKIKTIKEKAEDGTVYEGVEKVGTLTLEFDGDVVDVTALNSLIHGKLVTLGIENTQRTMEFNASSADAE